MFTVSVTRDAKVTTFKCQGQAQMSFSGTNGQMCFHRCTFLYCSHIFYTFSHFLLSALCLFSFSSSSFEGQPLLTLRLRVFKKNELIELDVIHTHPPARLKSTKGPFCTDQYTTLQISFGICSP